MEKNAHARTTADAPAIATKLDATQSSKTNKIQHEIAHRKTVI